MLNELAIDAEGEPFEVPTSVTRWRVRRVEGRGRPGLVYARALPGQPGQSVQGSPLLLEVGETFAALAKKAGPGRYRLDPVDTYGRRVEGVPVAVTGPLEAIDDTASEAGVTYDEPSTTMSAASMPVRRATSCEELLCVTVEANTRLVEKAIGQLGALMTAMADLLGAANGAGLTNRVPLLLPPPPAPKEEVRDDDEEAAATSGMPEWLTIVIQQVTQALVPVIVPKLAGLSGLAGMPLSALVDWSKAVPNASSSAPQVPTPTGPSAHATPYPRASAAAAGAATSGEATAGATSTEAGGSSASSGVPTDDSAPIAAHVTQVWQALSIPEQTRVYQLISLLTPEERTAWIAELVRLTVPEAVVRVRSVIQRQSPAPMPQLATGDGEVGNP